MNPQIRSMEEPRIELHPKRIELLQACNRSYCKPNRVSHRHIQAPATGSKGSTPRSPASADSTVGLARMFTQSSHHEKSYPQLPANTAKMTPVNTQIGILQSLTGFEPGSAHHAPFIADSSIASVNFQTPVSEVPGTRAAGTPRPGFYYCTKPGFLTPQRFENCAAPKNILTVPDDPPDTGMLNSSRKLFTRPRYQTLCRRRSGANRIRKPT